MTKIGDFEVDFHRDFEAIYKKALPRVSGAQGELFDERKPEVKISCPLEDGTFFLFCLTHPALLFPMSTALMWHVFRGAMLCIIKYFLLWCRRIMLLCSAGCITSIREL
jgi:hypothetical protein